MDITNRVLLTNEQQMEAREWERLFDTPAWQWMAGMAQAQIEQLKSFMALSAMTEGDLREARGRLLVWLQVAQLDALKQDEYNNLTADVELTRADLRESAGANS